MKSIPTVTQIKGIHYRSGQPVAVEIHQGHIQAITVIEPAKADHHLPLVAPGLVDLQVNGYQGADFNADTISEDTVRTISNALVRLGVTAFYPTIITNGSDVIARNLSTIAKYQATDDWLARCIAGIHLEGPFLSPKDGPRGAHPVEHVKAPDWELFQAWQDAANGQIRIITLAPEWPGALSFIERCVAEGVTVSIGHSDASPQTIRDAVSAGARLSTHLGNGCSITLNRHQNLVYEQLANDALHACFIADGFHLPPAFLTIALRTKNDKAMLVSDVVALGGMPPSDYHTPIGGRVILTPAGKLHLAEHPEILAGSAANLTQGIAHLVNTNLAKLPDAWDMASTRPAAFMQHSTSLGLSIGAPANLTLFKWQDRQISIHQTIQAGQTLYRA